VIEVACPSCGAQNPTDFRFCGTCGSPLDQTCPACGHTNPPGNRFCGACGTRLGPDDAGREAAFEERKIVTMLFADLTASTEMAARLDPEDLRSVLKPFFEAMAEEVERYGGTVEKFIGDAVVAAFGAPVAHEDDPERAIRCALAMQRRLSELNAELAERAGDDLSMRIGINTGEVIAHGLDEGIVTGEAVNIAARFQSFAEPGSVVVAERTLKDTRHGFLVDDLGEVSVKGVDRPLRVFAVRGEAPMGDTPAAGTRTWSEAPLVGRDHEMELLRLIYARAARERRPTVVTIVGPPGIGKSRLAREGARVLREEGARVVRGRCLPYGHGLTYWPLAEILRADAGIKDNDPVDTVLRKAHETLDPRFPGDEGLGISGVLLSSIGVELPTDPLVGAEREAVKRLISVAWRRYLESLAVDGPMVALVEDVHWADSSLLEFLEGLGSSASGPIVIVCMARPDLFERRPEWGGGPSNATTISLEPLSEDDASRMIDGLLEGHAPAEIVDAILRRSEGNPFYAGELLRMMVDDGTIVNADAGWTLTRALPSALPDTVQAVIASRIDLLTPIEKRVIQDASVIGRTFWTGAVERLGSADAEQAIESLVAKGPFRRRERSSIEGEREYVFNHVLTRDVAYASIPRTRRRRAHAAMGAWGEEATSGRSEEYAEILAHHFSEAGDGERTARYALLAGQRLLRLFAAQEAIGWFDRAMEAAGSAEAGVRAQVALGRGAAREQLGRLEEARADYGDALAEARGDGDAELEARALAAIAHVLWLLDRYDEGRELLPEALERARAVGLTDVEVRLLYTAGTMHFGRGRFAESIETHERALAIATESGDLEGQALAHHGLSESYFFHSPLRDGLRHGLVADQQFRELGQRSMVAHNAYMVAWLKGFTGRPDEALAYAVGSIETSHEIGNAREEGLGLLGRAELHRAAGRMDAGVADVLAGTEILRAIGAVRGEMIGRTIISDIAAEAWAFDRVVATTNESLELSEAFEGTFMRSMVHTYRAWSLLLEGDRDAAERSLAEAHALNDVFLHRAWSGRVEVQMREWAGEAEGLADVGARIERDVLSESVQLGSWGRYARALSAWSSSRPDEALEGARTALEMSASVGESCVRWRSARVAALSADALGRADEAAGFRNEAVAVLEHAAANVSGELRAAFLARPDVAELLG
jgi:class 3 adenylate cyclase/tetratricopeptide (TPR) repeat protein